MIRIYDASYTANQHLNSNGSKILQPQKCIETKSEDEWKLEVEIDDSYADFIEQNNVIVVKTKEGLFQPFRIGNVKLEKHVYSFEAKHVFFDLENYMVEDLTLTDQSGPAFIAGILSHTTPSNSFTGSSDILTAKSGSYERQSAAEVIFEARALFGGHLKLDNFNVQIVATIGANRGVEIREGKNLEGITKTEVWDNVVTKLIPTCGDRVYDALNADVQYDVPYVKTVSFESDYETEAEIEADVIAQATEYLNKNKYPQVNYVVKSDIVQNVQIGDTIKVVSTYELNTSVLAYKYDSIIERIISVEFGNFRPTVKNVFKSLASVSDVQSVKAEANQLIIDQTNIINGLYKNGYVVINDNEIFVVDTLPKENATYVLRMNLGGIGFSSSGVNGPFTSAWTLDGKFNANFIQTGTLNAGVISVTNLNAGNITTGTLNAGRIGASSITADKLSVSSLSAISANLGTITGGSLNIGNGTFTVSTGGALTATSANISGTINSSSGTIGGWSIGSNLSRGKITLGYDYIGLTGTSQADATINFIYGGTTSRIYSNAAGVIGFSGGVAVGGNISCGNVYGDDFSVGGNITVVGQTNLRSTYPVSSNSYNLGSSGLRWATIWQTSGSVTGSDERLKEDIKPIENGIDLILNLDPVQYKLKDGSRVHYGLIAQQVKETMNDVGINDVGVYIDPNVVPDWDVNDPEQNDKIHYLALRYEELIAPMIQTIKSLNERIKALEDK